MALTSAGCWTSPQANGLGQVPEEQRSCFLSSGREASTAVDPLSRILDGAEAPWFPGQAGVLYRPARASQYLLPQQELAIIIESRYS